mgnify:CR=1 FL=1
MIMNNEDCNLSRRRFLKGTGILAATAVGPLILPGRLFGGTAPSGKINIGMIGMGRQMITMNLPPFLKSPDCQVVAVCDVDAWRMDLGLKNVNANYAKESRSGSWNGCKVYKDWRDLIADKDIDALMPLLAKTKESARKALKNGDKE